MPSAKSSKSQSSRGQAEPLSAYEMIQKVVSDWFVSSDSVLFAAFCSHQPTQVPGLPCVMRVGQGRLEYDPVAVARLTMPQLAARLKVEMIRIVLKHPYDRQPDNCPPNVVALASDCVISSFYSDLNAHLVSPEDFQLPKAQSFEWYAFNIKKKLSQMPRPVADDNERQESSSVPSPGDDTSGKSSSNGNGEGRDDVSQDDSENMTDNQPMSGSDSRPDGSPSPGSGAQSGNPQSDDSQADNSQDNQPSHQEPSQQMQPESRVDNNDIAAMLYPASASAADLWQQDDLMVSEVNDIIKAATSWGSIPGLLAEHIVASTRAQLDYRKVLAGFRSSVISSHRNLTRMRPNRRTDFQNMGSVYRLRSRILVAVDVSGSVSSEMLADFFSVINRFFKYGAEELDVMQFDCVCGQIVPFKKASPRIEVLGRGGTSFQAVIDAAAQKGASYDGLLIFTDGYAPAPVIPVGFRTRILWVCHTRELYEEHRNWMLKKGRACFITLPSTPVSRSRYTSSFK